MIKQHGFGGKNLSKAFGFLDGGRGFW